MIRLPRSRAFVLTQAFLLLFGIWSSAMSAAGTGDPVGAPAIAALAPIAPATGAGGDPGQPCLLPSGPALGIAHVTCTDEAPQSVPSGPLRAPHLATLRYTVLLC